MRDADPDTSLTASIALDTVTVRYRGAVALDRVSLSVAPGEVKVLLGPSGSGKSTILRAIAGFVPPTSGRIMLAGRDVTALPPHARGLGMVVQNYALFPHLTVAANVGFGLNARRLPKPEIAERVAACLDLVGMAGFAGRYPRELSGGQQQRVAIARALAIRPPVLLLDEPLSALDAPLRAGLLDELRSLHARLPELAIVYVTHDQGEAIALGDRIVLMREGRIAACGTPRSLYETPEHRYAAEFFGQANLLPVRLEACHRDLAVVNFDGQHLTVRTASGSPAPRPLLCLRPHAIEIGATGPNRIAARITGVQWMGPVQRVQAVAGAHSLRIDLPAGQGAPAVGTMVTLGFDPGCACLVAEA